MRTEFTPLLCATVLTLGVGPFANARTAPVATPSAKAPATTAANASDPELTLEEAIQIAFANHGNVSSARQSASGAQSRITAARSGLYPQASVSVSSNLARGTTATGGGTAGGVTAGDGTGSVSTSTSYTTSTQTNFGLTQSIFDGGRTRAQVRQAQANATSAGAGIGMARQNLAFTVASNFYEQLRQERLVVQRGQQAGLAEQQLAQIEAQIEAGTAARVDAQSVRVTLSQARFDLTSARNALETAKTSLRSALGLGRGPALRLRESSGVAALSASFAPLSTEQTAAALAAPSADTPSADTPSADTPSADTPSTDAAATSDTNDTTAQPETPAGTTSTPTATPVPLQVPAPGSLSEYISEAQRRRPDLMQSRASVQSGEASVSIAKAGRLPQVGLTAGYNLQNLTNSGRGPTAGLSLSLPLFDAGGGKADVKAAQADLAASRNRLAQLEKDVAADVEASYVSVSGAVERISNAQPLLESARVNLEAATEKYRAGVGIVLDVVNAQTQFAQAQTSATAAIYDYQIALADLSRATGSFAPDTTPQTTRVLAVSAAR